MTDQNHNRRPDRVVYTLKTDLRRLDPETYRDLKALKYKLTVRPKAR